MLYHISFLIAEKGDGNKSKDEGRVNTAVSITSSSEGGSNKKTVPKSFFPKFQSVSARKKSFHHLVIMNLLAEHQAEGQSVKEKGQEGVTNGPEEDLEEENEMEKWGGLLFLAIDTLWSMIILNSHSLLLHVSWSIP